ncbi:hypothetical protein [Tautonia sociabilis]|uniref:hypothetical protein n=1 Tax=Tautonia sociabilis TaxID=2080755 RepID=UPI0013155ACB|nr:hypothetical protein [Tautonia sociabilis]
MGPTTRAFPQGTPRHASLRDDDSGPALAPPADDGHDGHDRMPRVGSRLAVM